jgi:hypothetical protein
MRIRARLEITRQPVKPYIAFFFLRSMTANAVFLQKRFKRFRPTDGTGEAEDYVEDKART